MLRILFVLFLLLAAMESTVGQPAVQPVTLPYKYPQEKEVARNLERWRDLKFGMIIHWGLYAVPGIVESWSLCDEDWITRDSSSDYAAYKAWYWGLSQSFNPQKFDPDAWASAAKAAGMRYLVFTTKHHDGFNMFDTRYSEFKITNGPFKADPRANVAKHVFDAFRRQSFMIGAYFSKPDWHSPDYWWNNHATPDRNVNYDIRKYPWRWNRFVQYTHNQVEELVSDYGPIDILWLDGGWVRPRNTITEEVLSWGAPIPDFDQSIDMPLLAQKVRRKQPGILIVDRTVHGEYENYKTPEQAVPKVQSDEPWESCITLGNAWGYVPGDQFKTREKLIHTLVEIVAKGGNLLLGVGPTAEGIFLPEQVQRLEEIGKWLQVFGEGIYGTRSIPAFRSENVFFTRGREKFHYAIPVFSPENRLGSTVTWEGHSPKKGSAMTLPGEKQKLKWKTVGHKTTVQIPLALVSKYADEPAIVIRFEME